MPRALASQQKMRALGLVLALCLAPALGRAAAAKEIAVLFTGETHAMLGPCECPIAPEGGVARRATAIRAVRRGGLTPTLLVDAGGMFAGGVYDEYTLGREVDRERTLAYLRAVRAMGYDALAVGDEELAWGVEFLRQAAEIVGAPFVSANVRLAGAPQLVRPYVIKEVGGKRFGVFGLTTDEVFCYDDLALPQGVTVEDPIVAAQRVVRVLRPKVDFVVALSHLGEERSRELAEKVAGIDIIVNGHRRTEAAGVYDEVGQAIFLQFSFQGRALGRLDLILDEQGKLVDFRAREIRLGDDIADDPQLAQLVRDFQRRLAGDLGRKIKARLELYVMADCPYGQQAERTVFLSVQEFGRTKVDVARRFIASVDERGVFRSLHGPEEVQEDLRQICIERLYGGRVWEYALNRGARAGEPWEAIARAVGMEPKRIADCLERGLAQGILRRHVQRTTRLRIDSSPTIYINNRRIEGPVTYAAVVRALCGVFPEVLRPAVCARVPACERDADCVKPGKIGICQSPGTPQARCVFRDPVPVRMTVLTSDKILFADTATVEGYLARLFPGLQVEHVDRATPRGKALEREMNVSALPAYFLDKTVEKAARFSAIEPELIKHEDCYQLGPRLGRPTLLLGRKRAEGRVDLFIPALGARSLGFAAKLVRAAQRPVGREKIRLFLHWICFRGGEGELEAPAGLFELEEAARQAAVWRLYPEKLPRYLEERAKAATTSYWDVPLRRAGLDPAEIRRVAQSEEIKQKLLADADLARAVGIRQGLALLYANQEVALILTPEQLASALDRLGINAERLTVLYSSNLNGMLRACGCPGNPFGGVARMARVVRSVRQALPHALLLDAGDMLAGLGEAPDIQRATYMLKAAQAMGYTAVAVGDQDVALGKEFLQAVVAGNAAPFVCSNATWADGQPVAPRYRVVRAGGVRVGIIALLSERAAQATPAARKLLRMSDPLAAARELAAELRGKVDVLIALSHQTRGETQALAEAVPELDVIVAGHTGLSLKRPRRAGQAWLVQAGRDGEFVGRLTVKLDERGAVAAVEGRLVTLDSSVAEDPEVQAIVAEFEKRRAEEFAARLAALPVDAQLTPEACGRCHARELEQWRRTGHARAAATLEASGRLYEPECWRCHSTKPTRRGFAEMPNVSCVACHRVKRPTATGHERLRAEVPQAVCLACHTTGRSPNFDYGTYLSRVVHRGAEVAAR